ITSRGGHCLANGHLVKTAGKQYSDRLIISTDTHAPEDLIDEQTALQVVRGAGCLFPEQILENNKKLFTEVCNG
ncbi:MAG: PHP domain-containing protein, partial [bacterium]